MRVLTIELDDLVRSERIIQACSVYTLVAYKERQRETPVLPDLERSFAILKGQPAPLGAVGFFLEAMAARDTLPPVPSGLPKDLTQILETFRAQAVQ